MIESSSSGEEIVSLAGVVNTLTSEKIDFQQVVDLIHGPADTLFNAATTDRVVVATTIPNPFKVDLDPLAVPLATDGTLGLKVRVARIEDFDLPIELRLSYLPEWIEASDKIIVPADQSETLAQWQAVYKLCESLRHHARVALHRFPQSNLRPCRCNAILNLARVYRIGWLQHSKGFQIESRRSL